jgi:tripartite-type tricarboxylate transporter receptor subunit TctC
MKNILIEAIRKAVNDPYWKDFLDKFGYGERFLAGKEFEEFFKSDLQMLDKLLRAIGMIK